MHWKWSALRTCWKRGMFWSVRLNRQNASGEQAEVSVSSVPRLRRLAMWRGGS